jgi:cbb3-type cytochrome oxidase cytochrome c subunit
MPRQCPCGSGEYQDDNYDGHGIFLCYSCSQCHAEKMKGFRSDIFEAYDCDEPIYED